MPATITGLDALARRIERLPVKTEKKFIRKALRDAAKPVLARARAGAPKETGLLRRSLGLKGQAFNGGYIVMVGPRKKTEGVGPDGRRRIPWRYAHMQEFKSYSTRNFKTDHIRRLKLLKLKTRKSVESLLIETVEIGLTILEMPTKPAKGKRFAPFGIKETNDE